MNFLKFIGISCLGRGGRFFLVSTVLMLFGETIKQYLNYVILAVSAVLVVFFFIMYKKRHSFIKNENTISIIDNKQNKEAENKEQEVCL